MQILDGKKVAEATRKKIQAEVQQLKNNGGPTPCLVVVLVGSDPASQVYVRNKVKTCAEVGIESKEILLSSDVTINELHEHISRLNKDKKVHGILVQLPLPDHLNKDEVLSWIDPKKDPDGLTVENLGLLMAGRPRVASCTPSGVIEILKFYDIPIAGKKAVVIGRSQIVGLPMAHLLMAQDATVTICHSKTVDTAQYTKQADIVVVAAGRAEFIGKEAFSEQAVVIDVGIHRKANPDGKDKLCGDVKFDEVKDNVMAITPVPGGVGPMTIAMLLKNTLELTRQSMD